MKLTSIILLLVVFFGYAQGVEKLPQVFLIEYGNASSPVKVIEYFSFSCPHCVNLFRKDFQAIKIKYMDTQEISWIFHPVPMDLLTVQAMHCLEKLNPREKRLFLEVILEEIIIDQPEFSLHAMEKAMEIFEKPQTQLRDKRYLSNTTAFNEAFKFLKQPEKVEALPTVEINGVVFHREFPDREFLEFNLRKLLNNGCKK